MQTTDRIIDGIALAEVRTLSAYGLSDADRDDLAQEARIGVFLAMRRLEADRPESERRAYLGRSARSTAIEFLRWRSRKVGREVMGDDAMPASLPGPSIEDVISDREGAARVAMILDRANLSPVERAIVLDRMDLAPLPAEFAMMDPGTKFDRVRAARRKIARVLDEIGGGL